MSDIIERLSRVEDDASRASWIDHAYSDFLSIGVGSESARWMAEQCYAVHLEKQRPVTALYEWHDNGELTKIGG